MSNIDIFVNFTNSFGKDYNIDYISNFYDRYRTFMNTSVIIDHHNSKKLKNYQLGINKFADYYSDEYNHLLGYTRILFKNNDVCNFDNLIDIPDKIDWRDHNAVTPVKNQGNCGSCWSFSTIGAMEGAYYLKYKDLINFSEQQLVDCNIQNDGCEGGNVDLAFDYFENHYVCELKDYEYFAIDEQCRNKIGCNDDVKSSLIKSYCQVSMNDENELKKAVSLQPVSVAIEADSTHFRQYHSGIFDYNGCGTDLDHAVLVIGYGTENGIDYWIVKNSWGTNWGEDGYIRIKRNTENSKGQCGIAMQPLIPFF